MAVIYASISHDKIGDALTVDVELVDNAISARVAQAVTTKLDK